MKRTIIFQASITLCSTLIFQGVSTLWFLRILGFQIAPHLVRKYIIPGDHYRSRRHHCFCLDMTGMFFSMSRPKSRGNLGTATKNHVKIGGKLHLMDRGPYNTDWHTRKDDWNNLSCVLFNPLPWPSLDDQMCMFLTIHPSNLVHSFWSSFRSGVTLNTSVKTIMWATKKDLSLSFYWLFDMDPCNGLLQSPQNWVV